jgi:putative sigma-54 modulation protein
LKEVISVQINISVRHGQLSEATRARLQAKLEKLDRIFERLTTIDLTVDLEHSDAPSVELRVSAEHKHDFVATQQAEGLMAAVDGVMHKLEQQLRKYKEKVQDHHRTRGPRTSTASTEPEAAGE